MKPTDKPAAASFCAEEVKTSPFPSFPWTFLYKSGSNSGYKQLVCV